MSEFSGEIRPVEASLGHCVPNDRPDCLVERDAIRH
jgi:hypothetical protein